MNALIPLTDADPVALAQPGRRFSTIDTTSKQGQLLAYRAATGSDFTLDDLKDQEIEVANVFIHWVEDRGEMAAPSGLRRRIVLIAADGTRVSGGSESALRCLLEAVVITGHGGPWVPPLRFKVIHNRRGGEPGHWIGLEWLL